MPEENQTETLDQVNDAHIASFEAWQADPANPELKDAATKATAKWKDSFSADKKAREAEKKAGEEAAAKSRPPEKYDLKLAEGSKLDAKAVDDIAAFAKSNGLSQDAAKALLERENQNREAYVEAQKQQLEEAQKQWVESIKADKEIGGDKLKESVEGGRRALEKFGSESLIKELDETGLGNHPELVRFLARIGKAMREDKVVLSQAPTGGDKIRPEKALYPNMAKEMGRE